MGSSIRIVVSCTGSAVVVLVLRLGGNNRGVVFFCFELVPLVDVFCYFQQCAVASEVVALCSVIFFALCVKSLMSSLHSFASRPCFHGAFNDTIIPGFHSAAFHVHLSSQRDVTSIACLHCFFSECFTPALYFERLRFSSASLVLLFMCSTQSFSSSSWYYPLSLSVSNEGLLS